MKYSNPSGYTELDSIYWPETLRQDARINNSIYLYDNIQEMDWMLRRYESEGTYKMAGDVIVIAIAGEASITINQDVLTIQPNDCLYITSESIISIHSANDDFRYVIFRFTSQTLFSTLTDMGIVYNKLKLTYSYGVCQLSEDHLHYLVTLYRELKYELLSNDTETKEQLASCYTKLILTNIINIFHVELSSSATGSNSGRTFFHRFIDLLNEYGDREHSVAFYADKLEISTKYLSSITIDYSGKNASTWIQEYVVTRAKSLLREYTYKVNDVAEILNFPSQSAFGRYFRNIIGISPLKFVQQSRQIDNSNKPEKANK